MMTIQDLLKTPHSNLRIGCGDVWLYWDDETEAWVVRQHRRYARMGSVLYCGDEAGAVEVMLREMGIETEGK